MNQYYLLLGPAAGFVLGVFFTWFLLYSRLRLQELNAARQQADFKEKIAEFDSVRQSLAEKTARLDEIQHSIENMKQQMAQENDKLSTEIRLKSALEEQTKKIPILEKHITELREEEKQAAVLRQRLQELENQINSTRRQYENEIEENSQLREELKAAATRYDNLSEKLRDIAVLRERTQKLESENINLLRENEQLRNMDSQLKQISEIKEIYNRTMEENQALKNQDMARHLQAIKDGLQQSIKAFNTVMRISNNPLLTDLVEAEAVKIEDHSNSLDEEVALNNVDENTSDLEDLDKLEGNEQ